MELRLRDERRLIAVLAPRFLVGVGLVGVGGVFYLLFVRSSLVDVVFPDRTIALLLLGVPAVGLICVGYWLETVDLDPSQLLYIAISGSGGTLVAALSTAVVLLLSPLQGLNLQLTFLLFVSTGTEGALLGVLVGVFGVTDVLRRREREAVEELRTLHALLRHDIRNRVTIMDGYLTRLTEDLESYDPDDLEKIRAQFRAIEDLLADTEVAAKATARPGRLEPVDLTEVVESQARLIRDSHEGVSVTTALPDEVYVRADDLLAPAIENVLSNAAIHDDEPETEIDVAVEADRRKVRLRIADDGPGIPAERRDVVFDREVGDGTGMGLYLVEKLVDRYGGSVTLEGNDPRGLVVTITLSRARRDR